MGFISDSETSTGSGSYSSDTSDPDLNVDEFEVTLKLGGVESTLSPNGNWQHKFPKKNPDMQKLSNCRAKMQRLVHDNEKLRLKYDILFNFAKSASTEFEETRDELIQLRKIWKQTQIGKTKSKSKSKRAFSKKK